MSHVCYLLTINNPDQHLQDFFECAIAKWKPDCVTCQLEVGANGTPHIQAAIYKRSKLNFKSFKKFYPTAHLAKAVDAFKSLEYCMKEDTRVFGPLKYGELPVKNNSKYDHDKMLDSCKRGALDELPAKYLLFHYKTARQIATDYAELKVEKLTGSLILPDETEFLIKSSKRRHLWIWSPEPNTGKTTFMQGLQRYGVHWMVYDEKFQDIQKGTQVVLMDEY